MADARTESPYSSCIASDGFSLGYTGAGFSLLKLKSDGTTIILASHSKEDIQTLCDTVIEMDKGDIVFAESRSAQSALLTK